MTTPTTPSLIEHTLRFPSNVCKAINVDLWWIWSRCENDYCSCEKKTQYRTWLSIPRGMNSYSPLIFGHVLFLHLHWLRQPTPKQDKWWHQIGGGGSKDGIALRSMSKKVGGDPMDLTFELENGPNLWRPIPHKFQGVFSQVRELPSFGGKVHPLSQLVRVAIRSYAVL